MLERDVSRLKDCYARTNVCPLGAGALAGSSYPLDRESLSQSLGFDSLYLNHQDAVSDRDFIIEFLSASAIIMQHFSRLSEQLILWSSQEFNFIAFGDAFCTGSSIMPQKKNPDVAELARGKTGRVYGALFNLLTILKGLPLAYNRDLQEDKEPLFDTIKTLLTTLQVFNPLLASLKINKKAMILATESGFMNATALAEYLVLKDLPFRKAHDIVGKIVGFCVSENLTIENLSLESLKNFSSLIEADVMKVLSMENIVKNHDHGNYQRTSQVAHEIACAKENLAKTKKWVTEKN